MTTETELAWAAGFFDGEGCTCFRAKRAGEGHGWGAISMEVNQKERTTLDRFTAAVGVGKVYGPYPKGAHWRWAITGRKCLHVVNVLWAYLSGPKRDQIGRAGLKPELHD